VKRTRVRHAVYAGCEALMEGIPSEAATKDEE